MNNHQKSTFHPLGDFLNPALALLGQGLRKSPIWQKLNFANHPYLCKGLYKKHFRVHHSKNEFARGNAHINGIESFWGYAKTRLVKFKGMNKNMFNLHLKECEFRFNNRKQNLYKILLEMFRKESLKLS